MTDTVHSFRSPVYAVAARRRLPPSFYIGVGIAVLIHAGLAWYLIQQTFSVPTEPPLAEGPIIETPFYKPPPPKPVTEKTPQKTPTTISVHVPETPPLVNVGTVPLSPVTTSSSGDPVIVTTDPGSGITSSSTSSSSYVKARWTRFPDGAALADYYPPRAAEDEVEGSATVQCTVMDTKGRVSCVTTSETPKGYGFGKQTEKMIENIGRVDTSQGDVQVGSQLLTTVKWTLQ